MNQDEIRRQQAKTREQRFLNLMEQEFNYPPQNCRGYPGRSAGLPAGATAGVETGPNAGDFALEPGPPWPGLD